MFIICPKCSAKYKIPEGIQLQSGQKLKCSACDFVFLKDEETPFVLENPVLSDDASTPLEQPGVAFSEPLHPASELKATPADSLPEAFKPIDTTPEKKKKGVGIVFLYLIFLAILCYIGWMFRDSLKPAIQTSFPSLAIDEAKIPPRIRQNALPVRPRKTVPLKQPVVEVKELTKESNIEKVPPPKAVFKEETKSPSKIEQKKVKKDAFETAPKNSLKETLAIPPEEVVLQHTKKDDFKPEVKVIVPEAVVVPVVEHLNQPIEPKVVLPEPTLNSEPMPIMPEPIIVPEPEIVPLFEIIDTPVPAGTAQELSVNKVSFRIEPTEEGVDQVLIEGQIQNNSPDKKSIPVLTVLAIDKEGHTLTQKKVHTSGDDLEAGGQMPFYTSLLPAPKNIDHIEVEF